MLWMMRRRYAQIVVNTLGIANFARINFIQWINKEKEDDAV
jgi:hypothetical protein